MAHENDFVPTFKSTPWILTCYTLPLLTKVWKTLALVVQLRRFPLSNSDWGFGGKLCMYFEFRELFSRRPLILQNKRARSFLIPPVAMPTTSVPQFSRLSRKWNTIWYSNPTQFMRCLQQVPPVACGWSSSLFGDALSCCSETDRSTKTPAWTSWTET